MTDDLEKLAREIVEESAKPVTDDYWYLTSSIAPLAQEFLRQREVLREAEGFVKDVANLFLEHESWDERSREARAWLDKHGTQAKEKKK